MTPYTVTFDYAAALPAAAAKTMASATCICLFMFRSLGL